MKSTPCYRICLWDRDRRRWRPLVTRTRSLLRTLRQVKAHTRSKAEVYVERRPGKLIPFPLPAAPGPREPRVYTGG